jgi:hypothetical protein
MPRYSLQTGRSNCGPGANHIGESANDGGNPKRSEAELANDFKPSRVVRKLHILRYQGPVPGSELVGNAWNLAVSEIDLREPSRLM